MCGIFAAISKNNKSLSNKNFEQALEMLKHRGPDSSGVTAIDNVMLGHCRLAIIDREPRSNQPLADHKKNSFLIFNGEIYNYKELRTKLVDLGVKFETDSDSEVLLQALNAWKEKAIPKLNGMFSFVYYNSDNKNIIIARDRYGSKPLYWFETEDCILVSSEIKAINKYCKSFQFESITIDSDSLHEYLTFQNFVSDRTLFKNISLVDPATYIEINTHYQNFKISRNTFWQWNFDSISQGKKIDPNNTKEIVSHLLEKSVEIQMIGDVEVGSFLSGGIDSSLVSFFGKKKNEELKSYTIGFEFEELNGGSFFRDETEDALQFARTWKINSQHNLVTIDDFFNSLEKIVYALEEPRVGQCYPNYYACALASKSSTVVLSGTGGDELFGGYPWRYDLDDEFSNWNNYITQKFINSHKLLPPFELEKVLKSKSDSKEQVRALFQSQFPNLKSQKITKEAVISSSLNFDARNFLQGLLLVEDKIGMNFSIETRFPFLDNNLVDYAMALPMAEILIKKEGNWVGKRILREIASDHFGAEIAWRNKQGFMGPDTEWFKSHRFNEFVHLSLNSDAPIWDFIDFKETHLIFQDHFEGRKNRRLFLWSVIYLNIFLKKVSEGNL